MGKEVAGLPVFGYFMIGNPGDTLETIRETMIYVRKVGHMGVDFSLAVPYPRTQLWEKLDKEGGFLMKDYSRSQNPLAIPRKTARALRRFAVELRR